MTSNETVPVETGLVVRDIQGAVRRYDVNEAMRHIIGEKADKVPLVQKEAFCEYCTIIRGNPLAKEVHALCYWDKENNCYNLSPHPAIQFLERKAAEAGPRYRGCVKFLIDADGKPLPATAPLEKVQGAVAQVHLADRDYPVEEIVTLEEAHNPMSSFWKNPKKQKSMLLLRPTTVR